MAELTQRQVLVNLGNRWAVLGTRLTLPGPPAFSPADGRSLERVADESEAAERRIVETLKVSTADVARIESADDVDLSLLHPDGRRTSIEIRVREHEPSSRDLATIFDRLGSRRHTEQESLELWVFNVERLKLHVYYQAATGVGHLEFVPLNIWEYGEKGDAFERRRVLERVEEWITRVKDLYTQIAEWTAPIEGLRLVQDRTIEMSEELMQKFAVPDRELPVLDIVRGDEPVVSFVPRGLWLIGSWGRIDIITRSGTHILHNLGKDAVDWRLADTRHRRELVPFDKQKFLQVLGDA